MKVKKRPGARRSSVPAARRVPHERARRSSAPPPGLRHLELEKDEAEVEDRASVLRPTQATLFRGHHPEADATSGPSPVEQVVKESATGAFNLATALEVQYELWKRFSSTEFQRALRNLESPCNETSKEFRAARQKLVIHVQSEVLPRFGFAAGTEGVEQMVKAFKAVESDREVKRNGFLVDQLLRVNLPGRPAPAAKKVVLTVRHAAHPGQAVDILAMSNVTLGEVKCALVSKTGVDEHAQGQLSAVPKNVDQKVPVLDAHPIGEVRELVISGVAELLEKPFCRSPDAVAKVQQERPPAPVKAVGKAPPSLSFTLKEALTIQKDLFDGFSAAWFEQKLRLLQERIPEKERSPKYVAERQQLALLVQSRVLPRYGFTGDRSGVMGMVEAFDPFLEVEDVQNGGKVLEQLLRGACTKTLGVLPPHLR